MARLHRFCPKDYPQHIIQRGNNRQLCFCAENDFAAYARWLKEYSEKFSVDLHAWVFMSNHVHLLATPREDGGISLMMQALGRRYVRYFNRSHERTGTLWEGRFKSCLVQRERYFLECHRYIEMNPVRAGMVSSPEVYHWSSYSCNALGRTSALCTPHDEYVRLGETDSMRRQAYRRLFQVAPSRGALTDIRGSVNKGLALGSDEFKKKIERLHGRRVRQASMGRPVKIQVK
jgi:putative transposase